MPDLTGADVRILDDPHAVADAAATWLTATLRASPERTPAVCLSGGQTPRLLYAALARAPHVDAMPWPRIHWFWCDERFVPPTDERSNFGMARRLLLDAVPVPRDCIHAINTVGVTPDASAADYERELQRYHGGSTLMPDRPLFTATLLGVGGDGHIASLFPGSPTLDERAHWVAAAVDGHPEPRITLTYPALESSGDVAFIVTGAAKRGIMQAIRDDARELPVSRLRPRGRTRWFLDRAAAPQSAS